jgi:hypothetical protein
MVIAQRFRQSLKAVLPVLILLAGLSASAGSAHAISIAQARALPLGTVVTVDGAVSTPSGAFESSFFDKGFGLQDLTGGIFISSQVDLHVAPRARARVTGALADSFGLLILVPADPTRDVRIRPGLLPVLPRWVRTAGVGESTEGLIVQVFGHVSQAPSSDLPFGYKFSVNDGSGEVQIFVNTQTGIDVNTLHLGQLVSVIGFSSQFDTHYEIDPRSPADILTLGH